MIKITLSNQFTALPRVSLCIQTTWIQVVWISHYFSLKQIVGYVTFACLYFKTSKIGNLSRYSFFSAKGLSIYHENVFSIFKYKASCLGDAVITLVCGPPWPRGMVSNSQSLGLSPLWVRASQVVKIWLWECSLAGLWYVSVSIQLSIWATQKGFWDLPLLVTSRALHKVLKYCRSDVKPQEEKKQILKYDCY